MSAEEERGKRGSSSGGGEGLFDLLRDDHREILKLFDALSQCKRSEMDRLLSLFNKIEEEVQRHFEGEERFLYSALEQHQETRDLVLEGYELHRLATLTIGAFKTLALDDERWSAKVRVLRRLVEQHVELVEEELFPAAGGVLRGEEADAIAEHFLKVKAGVNARGPGVDAPK